VAFGHLSSKSREALEAAMSQALYRKWRPQTFDQVVGQEHVTQTLRNALASERVRHAYLFAGLRGTGKTTMARLVAKAVNCLTEDAKDRPCNACTVCQAVNEGRFLDLIEIDAASHTGVDDVRELRDKIGFRPNEGRYKVYIIDEVHRFSGSAFDALLKTLEEPPDHAIFILATTEIHKVPATILSRCQRFDFRRISVPLIVKRLQQLADAEGIEADPDALALIARSATGSLRDAESLLDQLAAANVDGITLAQVQRTLGTIDAELVTRVVQAIVTQEIAAGLALIDGALDSGVDLRQFARQIVDHLRGMLLIQLQAAELLGLGQDAREALSAQADQIDSSRLIAAIKSFSEAEAELRGGWQPQLPLEMALVDAVLGADDDVGSATSDAPQPESARPASPSTRQVATKPNGVPVLAPSASASQKESEIVGSLTLQAVQRRWPQVLETVRERDKSVQALLNSTQPARVEGELLALHVDHEFARSKLSQERARRLVEDVLSQVLGQSCQVAYELGATDQPPSTEAPGPGLMAQPGVARPGVDHDESHDRWADDPLVQAAKEMGAEVRPLDERSDA
jgi:DNA polymerase-3 subunit gamma/tau